jgi:NAD-reducing hydrogenase small subunit
MTAPAKKKKLVVATTSLAGCFGCHMSFLDIDERILELVKIVDFNKSPIDDIKEFTEECDIGLVEGGCCNSENVKVLREFRKHCKVLIAVGQCAITGGLPAMRNGIPLKELFAEAYHDGPTVHNKLIPNDEEIPMILDRVYPCHEIVKIDAYLPGCAPRGDLFWEALTAVAEGRGLDHLSYENFKYD